MSTEDVLCTILSAPLQGPESGWSGVVDLWEDDDDVGGDDGEDDLDDEGEDEDEIDDNEGGGRGEMAEDDDEDEKDDIPFLLASGICGRILVSYWSIWTYTGLSLVKVIWYWF